MARIAPRTVIISDPRTIRRVLAANSGYVRGPWFDSLRTDPYTNNVVSERDPKKHQQRRQVLAGGLSGKDVPGAEEIVDTHVQSWMRLLGEKHRSSSDEGIKLDLSKALPYLSMDIITHLCLDEPFGNVETDTDRYGLLEALSAAMPAQQYIASLLELKACFFWLDSLPFLRGKIFPSVDSPTEIGRVMRVRVGLPLYSP